MKRFRLISSFLGIAGLIGVITPYTVHAGRPVNAFGICHQVDWTGSALQGTRTSISGDSLIDDLRGPYLSGVDLVVSNLNHEAQLFVRSPNASKRTAYIRSFKVNLQNPVAESGAVAQPTVQDFNAIARVYYKKTVDNGNVDIRFQPIGATEDSHRTQIETFINGKRHILQMGTWAFGDCQESAAYGFTTSSAGTTSVSLTRNSETSFTATAPAGSVGRLYDVSGIANGTAPIDKGLFNLSFTIQIDYL